MKSRCMLAKTDAMVLWHRCLGYVNLKTLKMISQDQQVHGVPNIGGDKSAVYGEFQVGKQLCQVI